MSTGMMQRFYENEGDFVSLDLLIDWVRAHPLGSGRMLPIIIWGGFGVGKCVRGDTPVWVNGSDDLIKDLWDRYSGPVFPDPDGSGGEWAPATKKLQVASINDSGQMVKGRIVYLYRQRVRELGRRVVLDDGSEITMTMRHRLRGPDGWQKQIRVGDRIALPGRDPWSNPDVSARVGEREEIIYARVLSVEDFWLDEYVYDLEVEEHHNYVAGGMICHNTQSIKAYGKTRDLEIRTYHPAHDVNGSDIVGQAYHDEQSNETRYALPAWLPTEDDAPEGLLFIDELNRAPQEVLAGLMEPLGEGTIAQSGWELPRGWNIVAAANPSEMGYMVQDLDEAMVDRMLHYAPGWDARHWGSWAQGANVPPEIIDFALRHQGDLVVTGESQLPLEIEQKLRTTPRTLEYMGALYEPGMPEGLLRVCSQGLMGREAAEAFRELTVSGDRPLEAEQILAEPVQDANGQSRYLYEDAVRRWASDNLYGDDLIRASSERLVIHLLSEQPVSADPHHERRASLAGRYLAFVPPHLREMAMNSFRRSAPQWVEVIQAAILGWSEALARQQKIFSQSAGPGLAMDPRSGLPPG